MQAKLAHERVWPSGRRTCRQDLSLTRCTSQPHMPFMSHMCCQRAPLEAQLHFQAALSGLARVKSHWRMTSTLQQGHEQPSSDSLLGVSQCSAKWCRAKFGRRLQKLQGFQLDQVTPPTIEFSKIKTPPGTPTCRASSSLAAPRSTRSAGDAHTALPRWQTRKYRDLRDVVCAGLGSECWRTQSYPQFFLMVHSF
jgi:hypothetical protein